MGGEEEEEEEEARERRQKAGGGGSAVASAAAVIPLLRASAAGGCAEGRSVEKIGGKKDGRKGEKGSAWAALQHLQLQQPVRRKEGEKETEGREEGCRIACRGFLCMLLHKEKELIRKPFFSPLLMLLYMVSCRRHAWK